MMRRVTAIAAAGGMALVALAAAPVQAQRPGDGAGTGLEDFVNSVAGQADAAIAARGWQQAGGNGRVNYWWNGGRGQCAAFVVDRGRYTTIQLTDPIDCNRGGGNGGGDGGWRPPVTPPGGGWSGGGWNNDRSDYADFDCNGSEGVVTVQLRGREGRIQLPPSLTPTPVQPRWGDRRPGGSYGDWWDLSSVSVSRNRVSARYTMAGAGTPRLTIDRRSGRISISGSNGYRYSGSCTASMAPQPR